MPGSTFASQLLTAGVQLGYVSQQIGHADVSVTARHHARWVGSSSYRAAMRVEPGEVSADLLARLDSPQSPPTSEAAGVLHSASAGRQKGFWGERGDSSPRPPRPQRGRGTDKKTEDEKG